MTFKIIYTNGDSYAAGDELGYSKHFPEMATLVQYGLDLKEHKDHTSTMEVWKKLTVNTKGNYQSYLKECTRLAYTAKVSSLLDIPSINLSKTGRSNQEIIALTIDYLENRLLNIYKPEEILVILGLTGFERYRVPYESEVSGSTSIMLNYPKPENNKLYEYYVMNHNNNYVISDIATHFTAGMLYFEKKGISVVLVDSGMFSKSRKYLAAAYNNALFTLIPEAELDMSTLVQKGEYCRHLLGHYSEIVHERTAEALSAVIKEKFKDKF